MPLPDLTGLADVGGLLIAVGVLVAVVSLFVRGDLVPRGPYERALARGDALDKTVATLANEVRSQNVLIRDLDADMAVLLDRARRTD